MTPWYYARDTQRGVMDRTITSRNETASYLAKDEAWHAITWRTGRAQPMPVVYVMTICDVLGAK